MLEGLPPDLLQLLWSYEARPSAHLALAATSRRLWRQCSQRWLDWRSWTDPASQAALRTVCPPAWSPARQALITALTQALRKRRHRERPRDRVLQRLRQLVRWRCWCPHCCAPCHRDTTRCDGCGSTKCPQCHHFQARARVSDPCEQCHYRRLQPCRGCGIQVPRDRTFCADCRLRA